MVQIQAAVASDSCRGGGGVTVAHKLQHIQQPRIHMLIFDITFVLLLHWKTPFAWRRFKSSHLIFRWSCCTTSESLTWISAINSSLVICCFSVTSMPFSCRIVLQHASTLSLIKTRLTNTGAIAVDSLTRLDSNDWSRANCELMFWIKISSSYKLRPSRASLHGQQKHHTFRDGFVYRHLMATQVLLTHKSAEINNKSINNRKRKKERKKEITW